MYYQIKNTAVVLLLVSLFGCNPLESKTKPLSNQSSSSASTSSAQRSVFQLEDFPKEACGDSLPTKKASSISLYPVFASYSESNLQKVKSSFCKDAFAKSKEDTGEKSIQVASFTSQEKAEQFSEFMREHLGSGEVGAPIRLIASIEGFPKNACGDTMAADSQPTALYPVFIDYSESNLATIQLNFCRDAFPTIREDTGKQTIQVASFTTKERAESFRKLMQEHLGSSEIGKPTMIKNQTVIGLDENKYQAAVNNIKELAVAGIPLILPTYIPNGFQVADFNLKVGKPIPISSVCERFHCDTDPSGNLILAPSEPHCGRACSIDINGVARFNSGYDVTYKGPNHLCFTIWADNGSTGDGWEELQRWTVNTPPFGKILLEERIPPTSPSSSISDKDKYLTASAIVQKPRYGIIYFFDSPWTIRGECREVNHEEAIKILESLQVIQP